MGDIKFAVCVCVCLSVWDGSAPKLLNKFCWHFAQDGGLSCTLHSHCLVIALGVPPVQGSWKCSLLRSTAAIISYLLLDGSTVALIPWGRYSVSAASTIWPTSFTGWFVCVVDSSRSGRGRQFYAWKHFRVEVHVRRSQLSVLLTWKYPLTLLYILNS